MSDHPPCYICLGPVPRREKETRWTWMRRPTCSRTCGWKYQNLENKKRLAQAELEHEPCPTCMNRFMPRKGDRVSAYNRRRFCSRVCAASSKSHTILWTLDRIAELEEFLAEHTSPPGLYRQAAEHFGCTKNTIAGAVHRHCMKRESRAAVVIEFPYQGCMWPSGHPGDADFDFCGAKPMPGKPYCGTHCAVAYMPPRAAVS
jgi:GcrA cell cycle regulator